jgi:hypothetical protein
MSEDIQDFSRISPRSCGLRCWNAKKVIAARLGRTQGFGREKEMNEAARLTDHEIEAAARVLYEEGRFHRWWPTITKSYDEFAATDPIGMSEFGGMVERISMAASRARLNREVSRPL